jgi:hypothetical protein
LTAQGRHDALGPVVSLTNPGPVPGPDDPPKRNLDMSGHRRFVLAGALCMLACGNSLLVPIPAEDVTITLAVSGGFAGVSWSIVVDGADREVRGGACGNFCDWSPGDVLVAISEEQVAALAQALDDAGVPGLEGRDYGTGCCDFFHYDLGYQRGTRLYGFRGTDDRLPPPLAEVVRQIAALGQGGVPMIVAESTGETDWPSDPFTLGEVTVDGAGVTAGVTYGGGCARHRMDLVAYGGWMESNPVQVNALITHDDGGDPCDAIVTSARTFDLGPLRAAWVWAYGEIAGERPMVILRLRDPEPGSPIRSVTVQH